MTKRRITKKMKKGMTPMELACLEYFEYCKYDLKLLRRWARMLEKQAIKFYIEQELDSKIAEEDLYDANDDQLCHCVAAKHNKDCKYYNCKPEYSNLKYSEKIVNNFKRELLRNY